MGSQAGAVVSTFTGQLILFAKAPRPGFVKSRLARDLGPAAACDAYRQMVATLLGNLAPLANVELRFAPDDAATEISPWLRPGWTSHPQGDGDLGRRLIRAFEQALARSPEPVIVIGSDCPDVLAADIEAAGQALSDGSADVVLGPARDGGYWLVGARAVYPTLFERIAWSTETVLRQTVEAARAARLRVTLLRELEDIDTAAEWTAYQVRRGFRTE